MTEKKRQRKHQVLEVIEGGLHGNQTARVFSWTVFILIILSNSFFLVSRIESDEVSSLLVFVFAEMLTILFLSAEIVLGFWTADIRFPESKHPRLKYLCMPMTIIGILALLPFYLGLFLLDPKFEPLTEILDYLMLLHMVKAWEIMKSARPEEIRPGGSDSSISQHSVQNDAGNSGKD